MAEDKTKKTDRRSDRPLLLACDLRGCPNRCKHCWLGDLPNQPMQAGNDEAIVSFFEPYFRKIAFYSWLREPDFTDDYRARWGKDRRLSRGIEPRRFELASFYRIVRDPEYVKFLKDVGTKKVQLTFFGLKENDRPLRGKKGRVRRIDPRRRNSDQKRDRAALAGFHQRGKQGRGRPPDRFCETKETLFALRGIFAFRSRGKLRRKQPEPVRYPDSESTCSRRSQTLLSRF